jgi:hypothetical protein
MTNYYPLCLEPNELTFICFQLNDEIKNLVHEEIYLDFQNSTIEITKNAYEKILYYLSQSTEYYCYNLKKRIQKQYNLIFNKND